MAARPTLLDEALEAHGGLGEWQAASQVSAHVRSGGLLPRTRAPRGSFDAYRLVVSLREPRSILDPYPEPGKRGVFESGSVRIESDGETIAERAQARETFLGASGRLRHALRWDALDALYFAGYAMWNYLSFPLLLTRQDVQVTEGEPFDEGGARWRRLDATFPEGLDTHSRRQSFLLDPHSRLRRHDYTASVVAPFAHAAHYCNEHAQAGGLVFPTRRRVVPRRRDDRSRSGPTIVWIELDDLHVDAGV